MKKFVEQYDIHISPERIKMGIQLRENLLRELYEYRIIAIKNYLMARLKEEVNNFDKASKIDKILSSIISFSNSSDFVKIEKTAAYDNEREFQIVVFEINTTNTELARFGIDLENNIFDTLKTIENQINE
jgi:hypothetical protein